MENLLALIAAIGVVLAPGLTFFARWLAGDLSSRGVRRLENLVSLRKAVAEQDLPTAALDARIVRDQWHMEVQARWRTVPVEKQAMARAASRPSKILYLLEALSAIGLSGTALWALIGVSQQNDATTQWLLFGAAILSYLLAIAGSSFIHSIYVKRVVREYAMQSMPREFSHPLTIVAASLADGTPEGASPEKLREAPKNIPES